MGGSGTLESRRLIPMDVSYLISPHLLVVLLSQPLRIPLLFNNNIRYLLFTRLHPEHMTVLTHLILVVILWRCVTC